MRYFYARVSTADQNLARQMAAATDYHPDSIFADKASGKNFDRPEYQKMKSLLTAGDEVIIKSIDRLGRDKQGIKEELQWFKSNSILVRIIDIPTTMIAFPPGQEWIADMVTNIVVEVLSSIAQQERETINNRRAEGIAAMPLVDGKGVLLKLDAVLAGPNALLIWHCYRSSISNNSLGIGAFPTAVLHWELVVVHGII